MSVCLAREVSTQLVFCVGALVFVWLIADKAFVWCGNAGVLRGNAGVLRGKAGVFLWERWCLVGYE